MLVTTRPLKLLIIAGARPNFMKIAPLIKAIQRQSSAHNGTSAEIVYRLIHTGQHYDDSMSDVFFKELDIPAPHTNLGVGSGSHAVQTASVMRMFEPVCLAEKPDWVMVVGDVNSTMACALVAAKLGIRIAHVEAGLRSFDRTMPEEINRIVTDALADLLLTPSSDADENLRREGIPPARIRLVGNIMMDTLVANLESARKRDLPDRLGLKPKSFAYVTLHRPSNVDDQESLRTILAALKELAVQMPVVFPMHPRTRKMVSQFGFASDSSPCLHILPPIGYHDSLYLSMNARLVLTDSGGLQEETTYFRTPCLTLRPNTERPVTLTLGSNRLTSLASLWRDIENTLSKDETRGQIPPLWDGRTAGRILDAIINFPSSSATPQGAD